MLIRLMVYMYTTMFSAKFYKAKQPKLRRKVDIKGQNCSTLKCINLAYKGVYSILSVDSYFIAVISLPI